jgi:predicted outer membrane lipoprotein
MSRPTLATDSIWSEEMSDRNPGTSGGSGNTMSWILGGLVIAATVVIMILWLPGSPTSKTATHNNRSPVAEIPDQPTPPLKPQPR